jgi:hypothetical protein
MSFRDRSIIIRFPAFAALIALAVLASLVLIAGSTADAIVGDGDVVLGTSQGSTACTAGTDVNCEANSTGVANSTAGGTALKGLAAGTGSLGVYGESDSGIGIQGYSPTSGKGVQGISLSSSGVEGISFGTGKAGVLGQPNSASAIGVLATNGNNGSATALKVTGKSSFSRSGKLTVPAGSSSATKSAINLTSSSMVFATIQGNQAGVYVQGVTQVAGTSGSFTIHLSKNTTANLPVAWFVVN